MQNGEIVILKYEEDGIYHGYIHEDITTLPQKVKKALVDNGFMKDATAKKLLKEMKKNMKELILRLSKVEFIKICADYELDLEELDYCCGEVKGYFIKNEFQLRIGQQFAGLFFEALVGNLKKVINFELRLHESLEENLGIMWNEKIQGKTGFFMVQTSDGSSKYWVGRNYEIWETFADANPHVSTWLYNDIEGNIIFEVTKTYKWSAQEPDEDDLQDPDYVTYEEFMKDYKPLIHRVIPKEVAIEWLDQAMKTYRGFFSTEENYRNMCKELGW